jgi:predicted transcriptional regulator
LINYFSSPVAFLTASSISSFAELRKSFCRKSLEILNSDINIDDESENNSESDVYINQSVDYDEPGNSSNDDTVDRNVSDNFQKHNCFRIRSISYLR